MAEALSDTPVVFVQGPRQAGKTTLVRELLADERSYLTLDDATTLAAATADPDGFCAGLTGSVALDEVQRAPELLRAIKASVDRDRRPGRFLLTGSAEALMLSKVADALVGRAEVLTLLPLSAGEIERRPAGGLDRLFDAENTPESVASAAWIERAVVGGFPEAVARSVEHPPRFLAERDAAPAEETSRWLRPVASTR